MSTVPTRIISIILSAALVLLSPGIAPYEALAGGFTTGRSAPPAGGNRSGFLQSVPNLTPAPGLGRLDGIREIKTADSGPRGLASAPDGRKPAARLETSGPSLPASPAAIRGIARAAADNLIARLQTGPQTWEAASIAAGLSAARGVWELLTPQQRSQLASEGAAFARRLGEAREETAARIVRDVVSTWETKTADLEAVVTGKEESGRRSELSRASAREATARKEIVEINDISAAETEGSAAKKSRLWPIGGAALIAAIFTAGLFAAGFTSTLIIVAGVIGSILLHETAHLWMLRRLGDDTAARNGLASLNPLKLIHPLGTGVLPALTAFVSQAIVGVPIVLGWAKPIPVDFNKLADPKRDAMKVAIAGPAMNAALAVAAGLALLALSPLNVVTAGTAALIALFAKINVGLALFNMLPLPQLDGGKVAVGLMPQRLYERWTHNPRLPEAYQSTFKRLYEGPSSLLTWLGMDNQGRVNLTTSLITLGAFALFATAGWAFLGAPILLLMLVCTYDYYCIREKIQNEEAVVALIDIITQFSTALARAAEQDDSIQSIVNTEEVEHVLKNALEDVIDKVVDSEGFSELDSNGKWARFEAVYKDAAVTALKQKGLSADEPETIRGLLESEAGRRYFAAVKGWVERYDVWTKWHSPGRKESKDLKKAAGIRKTLGGSTGALAVIGILGVGLLGAAGLLPAAAGLAFIAGTIDPTAQPAPATQPAKKQKSFLEAAADPALRLDAKQTAMLQRMLKEMKLEKKAPVSGRVKELEQLLSAITSPRGVINSAVFIGKSGVGKTAVVELLAQLLAQSDEAADGTFKIRKMDGRYLVKLNLPRLLQQDDPAAALDALLELLGRFNDDHKRSGNKVVLFVDEIHQIFEHPKGALMANLLKEPLRDGELTLIAATTVAEYKRYMENDDAFRRRLLPIWLEEATVPETMRALEGSKTYFEDLFGVTFAPEALSAAAELSRFDQERFLPGRAFDYLTAAATKADLDGQRDRLTLRISDMVGDLNYVMGALARELSRGDRVTQGLKQEEPAAVELYNLAIKLTEELVALYRRRGTVPKEGTPVVTEEMVKEEIALKTGVASGQLTLGQESLEKYLDMEAIVGERVIGQDEALGTIARTVRQNKAGLSDPQRPMGVFYLTGPTGSGKTHLAKELARFLFNDPNAMIRVDMTEYTERHSVSKFIGSPPGYVGFEAGGQLTEKVRRKPYSVVLLDEIEKAHPEVFLLLLQILGEGRLTDGQGRLVDFKNTLILMTSNLGMYAVDVETYARQFNELRERERLATQAADESALASIAADKLQLAERLSEETKRKTKEITAQAFKETYPPEFQGRLHAEPIVFNRLTPEHAARIAELNLKELAAALSYGGHEISWDPAVVSFIVNEGFSVALGARPLKNAIDRFITQPIAGEILKSAMANGQKVVPSQIRVTMERGEVRFAVEPSAPKTVARGQPGEGAAQEVFTWVLQSVLKSAANQADPLPTREIIDVWLTTAVGVHAEAEPDAEPTSAPAGEPSLAPAPTVVAAPRPSNSAFQPATPLALAGARSFAASHYEHERKDAAVKDAAAALARALEEGGYPTSAAELLLRTIEEPTDPYYGWLKLFVEHAKRVTPDSERGAPIGVSFSVDENSARLVVRRPGTVSEREAGLLRAHFGGSAPESPAQSRDSAEALNIMDKDGRRLMFDLHRKLSAVAGAKVGYASSGSGVEYWIEVPKPAPRPEPAAEPLPQAAREPAASANSSSAFDGSPPGLEGANRTALDGGQRGFGDSALKASLQLVATSMKQRRYAQSSRTAATKFLRWTADELKQMDPDGLETLYLVEDRMARLAFVRRERFSPDEMRRLNEFFRGNAELLEFLGRSGSRLTIGADKVTLEIPNSADEPAGGASQARSASQAEHPSASEADRAALAKIDIAPIAEGGHGPRSIYIELDPSERRNSTIFRNRLVALGVSEATIYTSAESYWIRARAQSPAGAAAAAFDVAREAYVRRVTIADEAHALLPHGRAAAANAPAATAPAAASPDLSPDPGDLRRLAKALAAGIIAQGEARGPTLRMAAADLLTAASTEEDLALARDWIDPRDLHDRYPEVAAAAMILARHGSRSADEAALVRALGYLDFDSYDGHLYNPVKRRVTESLSKLFATDNPRRVAELMERLREEKAKPANPYDARPPNETWVTTYRNSLLVNALYLALCKYAGPEARELLEREYTSDRAPQYYEYLKRVDPDYLRRLYRDWLATDVLPMGAAGLMTIFAVGDLGTRAESQRVYDLAAGGWKKNLSNSMVQYSAQAIASLVARAQAYDVVRNDVRLGLHPTLGNSESFFRMVTAIHVAGEAGDAADLDALERIIRSDPRHVNSVHEMTQHEAAQAWAKIVHRHGLLAEMMPKIQQMLTDTNAVVNKAAVEALRLRFQPPPATIPLEPGEVAAPDAEAIAPQAFLKDGSPSYAGSEWRAYPPSPAPGDPSRARTNPSRLDASRAAHAREWARHLSPLLSRALGVNFRQEVRVAVRADGGQTVVWVLKQAAAASISATSLDSVRDLILTLAHIRKVDTEARRAVFASLTSQGYEMIEDLYGVISDLDRDLGATMGIDHEPLRQELPERGEAEVWLRFDVPPPAPRRPPMIPRPGFRQRFFDPDVFDPDPEEFDPYS